MSKGGYKIFDQGGMYFVSFAVISWVDPPKGGRKEYRDIVVESLQHCQHEQGLVIYGWCIMSNHIHLIISVKENNVSDVLGTSAFVGAYPYLESPTQPLVRAAVWSLTNGETTLMSCPFILRHDSTVMGQTSMGY